jgi:hypothetical protein
MSGSWNVRNLEEIFLSNEFARSGASAGPLELSDGRSVLTPSFGQLQRPPRPHQFHERHRSEDPEERRLDMTNKPLATVLAFAPRTPAGRQRAIAALGGLAAVVLVVVGVTSGVQAPGSGHRSEALGRAGRHGKPTLPPADAPPSGLGVTTGVPGLLAADRARSTAGATNAASNVRGSFSVFNGAATDDTSSSGASGLPSGGTSVAPSLPSTPSTSALDPVTQLTSNVGAALSTTTQQIAEVLPTSAPITEVVNNVAGAVSGLTGTLSQRPTPERA